MTLFAGLTGSIGMGKSTTAAMFRDLGVPVHDADAVVHTLYAGTAAPMIEAAFPGTVVNGSVDRARLRSLVVGKPDAMARLEAIVHPLVRAADDAFREQAIRDNAPLAILDIPLLFETGGADRMDAIIVVSAPADVQRARVLARPGMDAQTFEAISARQLPDADKRARADFVVDTAAGMEAARKQVAAIVLELSERAVRCVK